MQQSNGSCGRGSNCYSKLATITVCLSLHFFITNSQQTKISCWFVSDDEKNKAGHHQGHATIRLQCWQKFQQLPLTQNIAFSLLTFFAQQ
jgi:hypothetical protein